MQAPSISGLRYGRKIFRDSYIYFKSGRDSNAFLFLTVSVVWACELAPFSSSHLLHRHTRRVLQTNDECSEKFVAEVSAYFETFNGHCDFSPIPFPLIRYPRCLGIQIKHRHRSYSSIQRASPSFSTSEVSIQALHHLPVIPLASM